jgi:hypothetical protein
MKIYFDFFLSIRFWAILPTVELGFAHFASYRITSINFSFLCFNFTITFDYDL